MGRRSKQKSCFQCVESKRRCDRSLPFCSRCIDREVECTYVPARRTPRLPALAGPSEVIPGLGSLWDPLGAQHVVNDIVLSEQDMEGLRESLFNPDTLSNIRAPIHRAEEVTTSSTSPFSSNPHAASVESDLRVRQLIPSIERLCWFLLTTSWNIEYQNNPPSAIPPAAVFTNFVRGLQSWLTCYLRKGHNPFIHRHLYSDENIPRCMQDAYAAIAVSQTITPDNEHVVDTASSTYVLDLLASHSASGQSFPLFSTRDHLARTQALLIHLLLSLFSPSIPRRAKAESLIDTLRLWARQLWESAALDATSSAFHPNTLSIAEPNNEDAEEAVASLYRAFVLSESVRRTFLLTSIATGVYSSLQQTWKHACHGDVCITARAELWDANSSARWAAVARKEDPLFLQSLNGYSLVERGVPAASVDEFARLLFTVMWGLEKVESWVISTGDSVSVMY
ncbi:mnng and nitrosoguanidine resistance protein [Colletotrichum karsti]|uniref:Mnng and nitrosoguanidine resistance protein n=1 Tax=Colletotrichum karsti TaxID=1095194 RepID=A0A9P6LKS9_9PEZI|nr:mnng and nitrosoguanidine resistance protein [Colletotrichum karsti]KAF9875882.1 mnng and nitrosoguanidine resistance protein [Colletotrichum karsti]